MPTALPPSVIEPTAAGETSSLFVLPDRLLAVPYIDTAPAEEHTITIGADQIADASLYNYAPTYRTGNLGQVNMSYNTDNQREVRPIVWIDLSAIPPDATITQALLTTYIHTISDDIGSPTCALVGEHWEEYEVCWRYRYDNIYWTTQGGSPVGNYPLPYTRTSTQVIFDLTAPIQDLIQSPANNHGVLFLPDNTLTHYYVWRSREYTDPQFRPYLTITFTTGGELPANTPRWFPVLFWYPDHPDL